MMANRRRSAEARAQMFDVKLLDLFAEVEWLLRTGREVQRDALRMRDVAPTNGKQRRAAMGRIQKRVDLMRQECRALCDVVQSLAEGDHGSACSRHQPATQEER